MLPKFVDEEVSISGNEVKEVQSLHAEAKLVPDEVSISANDVREEQLNHVL